MSGWLFTWTNEGPIYVFYWSGLSFTGSSAREFLCLLRCGYLSGNSLLFAININLKCLQLILKLGCGICKKTEEAKILEEWPQQGTGQQTFEGTTGSVLQCMFYLWRILDGVHNQVRKMCILRGPDPTSLTSRNQFALSLGFWTRKQACSLPLFDKKERPFAFLCIPSTPTTKERSIIYWSVSAFCSVLLFVNLQLKYIGNND